MASKFDRPPVARDAETGHELAEKVIFINRVAKVVKGGRRFSFSALVVIGDKLGKVGVGFGKASEVPEAIRKAIAAGKKTLKKIVLINGTIPHEVDGRFGAGHVFMKPASRGTGVIAGGPVRAIMESLGVKDILTKSIGSSNPHNVVQATMAALVSLRSPEAVKKMRQTKSEAVEDETA